MSEIESLPKTRDERARAKREALVGKSIAGRYVLRELIGHGGMGAVYEAEHLGLGKRVAIKFIDSEFATDEQVLARFAREARAMSAMESAHIVTVFDAGTEDGRPYLVMERLRGEDLGQRLRRTHRIGIPEAMHVIAQVLKGLAKAHAAGIIHRDLKPDNVFLVKSDTDPNFAKIVDFGISKIERPRDKTSPLALTGRGTVLGTPFYMSPEQAQAASDIDPRADLFSVGAILFECLSGRPPHTGETYEQIILSICMRDAPNLRAIAPNVPDEVASFVARALARDRTHRFANAERMLAALHEIAPEEKTRVPLDLGAPETLMSPGVLFPRGGAAVHSPDRLRADPTSASMPVNAETRLVGALSDPAVMSAPPATVVSPPPAMEVPSSETPRTISSPGIKGSPSTIGNESVASLTFAGVPSRRKRSFTTVVVTAIVATLLGVGVMLAIIVALDKKADGPSAKGSGAGSVITSPPTITSGAATGSPSPGAPATSAPAEGSSASETLPAPSRGALVPATGQSASTPATAAAAAPAKPRPNGPAKPAGTKLDISRDLP
jgi:eukaryotic-like serine/threonine-protein kinase